MTKDVDEGFRKFHGTLTPTHKESQAEKKHRASIETCLKNNFEIEQFFRTGSFGNGTSIRAYSDIDYFAPIPIKNLTQNSFANLQKVQKVLFDRLSNTGASTVSISTPTVKVRFGTDASESTEIVPADHIDTDKDGNYIYEIADGSGGWMKSSPGAHNNYVDEINNRLDEGIS